MSIKSIAKATQITTEFDGILVEADLLPIQPKTDPYSYVTKPDDQEEKLTDLGIIGVPENSQGCKPTVQAFPTKFNPTTARIWSHLIQNKGYQGRVRVWGSLDLIWHNTIQEFLELCEKVGVSPFESNLAAQNETVKDAIRRARLLIVQYMNKHGFFTKVKVRRAYREYVRTDTGMTLKSWADLYPLTDANLDFKDWLTTSPGPRMWKKVNNTYVKYIQTPKVRVWVHYLNKERIRIGFDIDIGTTVSIPDNELATKAEVDAFMDSTIYFPLIKSHRFQNVRSRLF